MKHFFFLLRYIRFWFISGNAHSIHSPFVFDFYTKVATPQKEYYCFRKIEKLRRKLVRNNEVVKITDYGAGTGGRKQKTGRISSITRSASKAPGLTQFIFKTILYFRPLYIFELGTSLGITTSYLAKTNALAKVITFEGCPELLKIARANFEKLELKNIISIPGNLNETLEETMGYFPRADFIFFDANHKYAPTMEYFHTCISKAHDETIFVFDDIHWSEEMEKAWKEICLHPRVTVSVDFFFLGVIFFHTGRPRQHFSLRL